MTREQIFEVWAPRESRWSPWVKPVLFSQMTEIDGEMSVAPDHAHDLTGLVGSTSMAIIVDLPGAAGVEVGLSLASKGYRPVPLYNACPSPAGIAATVDVHSIMSAIASATPSLEKCSIPADAPPAFLLDAHRNLARIQRSPGIFDNRSISLPTDFPSSTLLLSRQIREVVVVTEAVSSPPPDLCHTLRRYQLSGIALFGKSVGDPSGPSPITVPRPRLFRIFFYNMLASRGLIKSPLGGYGGVLPMPSSG